MGLLYYIFPQFSETNSLGTWMGIICCGSAINLVTSVLGLDNNEFFYSPIPFRTADVSSVGRRGVKNGSFPECPFGGNSILLQLPTL
jgi:hypothetical protein